MHLFWKPFILCRLLNICLLNKYCIRRNPHINCTCLDLFCTKWRWEANFHLIQSDTDQKNPQNRWTFSSTMNKSPHTNKQTITKSPNSPVSFCDLASVGFVFFPVTLFEEIPFTTLHTFIAIWTTEDHATKHFTQFMRSCIGLWCPTSTQLVQHPMLGRLDANFTISRYKYANMVRVPMLLDEGKETISALLARCVCESSMRILLIKTPSCLLHVTSLRQCQCSQSTLTNLDATKMHTCASSA